MGAALDSYRASLSSADLRDVTLLFLVRKGEVLLAMKKRGFGAGRWNGVGGKVEPGESIEDAARREAEEEIGVVPGSLREAATLDFYFRDVPAEKGWNQRVHTFFCEEWEGEPVETEEMAPRWFKLEEIPYKEMWTDDELWLPRALAGEAVRAAFLFGEGDVVVDWE